MMTKNIFLLTLTLLLSCQIFAQKSNNENSEFYINVFINSSKEVFVESQKTNFSEVEKGIKKIINAHPFKLDEKIIYRIFADENLKLGYIIDVNQQMNKAYNGNIKTQRFLLNSVELNIDGKNWFESKKIKELKGN